MGSEWQTINLADIAENVSRPFDFSDRDYVMFINTGDVLEGRFLHSDRESPKGLPGQAKKRIETGDLLFSEIRPANKRFALVDFDPDGYVVSTKFMVIRRLTEEIDPKFFYIQITCNQTLHEFQRIAESRSGTFPQITFDSISYYPFTIPPLPEQKAIAHVLGALDDRIELNRRMNETLEGMAQALFKSWFVDFDPVIDNALASGKEIPAELSDRAAARAALGDKRQPLPTEIRTLFPDEFTDSTELGWIPKGWDIAQLSDIATNPRRGIHAENIKSGTPYIGLQDMPQKSIALSSWGQSDEVASSKFEFHRGEILFGKLRPYFHKVGIAPVDGVCSTDILIVLPKKDEWFSVVFGHVTSVAFIEYVTAASTGTKMPRTNWKDMGSYSVVLPDKSLAKILTEQFEQNIAKILFNIEQSRELAQLRDTLLPKLLSGELRIPEAQKMVEELPL